MLSINGNRNQVISGTCRAHITSLTPCCQTCSGLFSGSVGLLLFWRTVETQHRRFWRCLYSCVWIPSVSLPSGFLDPRIIQTVIYMGLMFQSAPVWELDQFGAEMSLKYPEPWFPHRNTFLITVCEIVKRTKESKVCILLSSLSSFFVLSTIISTSHACHPLLEH